jgi:transposase
MEEGNRQKNNESLEEIAVWIGLDWATEEHKICSYEVATEKVQSGTVKHSAESLHEWLGELRRQYGGAKVAVVLEQSRGAVLYALMNCDFVVLYPVNPESLSSYRNAFYTSGAKDDPGDARLLMEMVRKHPERFKAWVAEDETTRTLRLLVEGRRKLVDQKVGLTNQLTSALKNYFPQALDWVGEPDSLQACDFLQRWSTLSALQRVRPEVLRKFYHRHGRPKAETLSARIAEIKKAVPLTSDQAAITSGSMMVKAIVAQIRLLIESIQEYDQEIKQFFQRHPDRPIFESFPGAGSVLAPRLLAVFGADRERWSSAAEIQTFSGIAPVIERSGKSCWVHWRWSCPKFVRQTFHEFAGSSKIWCKWAKSYYQMLCERGKSHHAALRALAFKWIRILFACWKNRTPYNDELIMQSLARRGSHLFGRIAAMN